MKSLFSRWAIKVAMRRPSPARIPLSGYERLRLRNYTTSNLETAGGTPSFLVQEVLPLGFKGLWFPEEGSNSEERTILNSELSNYDLLITYYFHELELVYQSGLKFLFYKLLFIPSILLWKERLARRLFNQKPLTRSDSIKVLRLMIEKTVNDNQYRGGPSMLMTELYGRRWAQHPELEKMRNYYSLVLEALRENGDLKYEEGVYRVSPSGLNRIEQFDQEDEKFRLGYTLQRRLLWLTVVLAAIGAIQAYVTYIAIPSPQ